MVISLIHPSICQKHAMFNCLYYLYDSKRTQACIFFILLYSLLIYFSMSTYYYYFASAIPDICNINRVEKLHCIYVCCARLCVYGCGIPAIDRSNHTKQTNKGEITHGFMLFGDVPTSMDKYISQSFSYFFLSTSYI